MTDVNGVKVEEPTITIPVVRYEELLDTLLWVDCLEEVGAYTKEIFDGAVDLFRQRKGING